MQCPSYTKKILMFMLNNRILLWPIDTRVEKDDALLVKKKSEKASSRALLEPIDLIWAQIMSRLEQKT